MRHQRQGVRLVYSVHQSQDAAQRRHFADDKDLGHQRRRQIDHLVVAARHRDVVLHRVVVVALQNQGVLNLGADLSSDHVRHVAALPVLVGVARQYQMDYFPDVAQLVLVAARQYQMDYFPDVAQLALVASQLDYLVRLA